MTRLAKAISVQKALLKELKIDFDQPRRHPVDRAPHIGYLMLEFLFSGSLSVLETFERARAELGGVHGIHHVPKLHYSEQLAAELGFPSTRATKFDLAVAQTFEDEFQRVLKSRELGGTTRSFKNKFGTYTFPVGRQARAFFSTQAGYIGLGPAALAMGDSVIVPFGSSRPLIVRSHGGPFALVGDAVVPGMMSGQLVDLYNEDSIGDDEFYIK